tara:strand:+ start:3310 stop:3519 length:210 start_codon:yes stop_codon:yes gene_type:complete
MDKLWNLVKMFKEFNRPSLAWLLAGMACYLTAVDKLPPEVIGTAFAMVVQHLFTERSMMKKSNGEHGNG